MPQKKIRVLVVDDHPIVRRGLCSEINLDPEMQVLAEAADGVEAVNLARLLQPDVILMDAVMPHKNGIDATAEILSENPDAKVLILTSFTEDERMLAAIKAGAIGYILKDRHPEEVLQAIRDTYNGKPYLNPTTAWRLLQTMPKIENTSLVESLTKREVEVLRRVAQGKPNKEIAREISVQEATVRVHVSNILGKLNLANRSQLVLYAIKTGLVQQDESNTQDNN
ncbi:MAG: response regulator transcription factor [Chloroflexi bacterium]|nr:response regulator transcription factor [Chloroflexota bacterium]